MIRSMTGMGRAEEKVNDTTVLVEARSLNHRFLEISVKLPETASEVENYIKKIVKKYIKRGTVQIYVKTSEEVEKKITIDEEKLKQYLETFAQIKKKYKLSGEIDISMLIDLPGVLKEEEEKKGKGVLKIIKKAAERAVIELVKMREKEGKNLEKDLKKRVASIFKSLKKIEKRAPMVVKQRQEHVKRNLKHILAEYDKNRLFEELLYLAERYDINEECIRLRNHCNLFLKTLNEKESNGRRLIFITQEMLKEANTIGAKSQDNFISQEVIKIKEEIEKLKEQLQNVE